MTLEFVPTVKLTVPFPVPVLPDVIVIQLGALLVAVQAHPAPAVTEKLPVPPAAVND